MKFGSFPLDEAKGGVAVHSIRREKLILKKGTRIGDAEIAALREAGIGEVVVALLEPGDIGEDEAAQALSEAAAGANVSVERAFTGRSNLYAKAAGVLVVDDARIRAVNAVDESITFATLPAFSAVQAGQMIATAKIIPFAAPEAAFRRTHAAAGDATLVRVAPFAIRKVAMISTRLPGLAEKIIDKTVKITKERLAPAGAALVSEDRVPHERDALDAAIRNALASGAELVLVFGASAIADRRDVIPAAIEAAGGRIEHFGMPVDPGNLMLVGEASGVPVLGAPGCARSPKENGFDWILMRLLAKLPVSRDDITAMGVGGLLMEIVTRPQPRAEVAPLPANRIAAIVLAAGRATRMQGTNKLLEPLDGKPLVRHAVEAALASRAAPVIVVTGHDAAAVRTALEGLDIAFTHNPDFAEGLSTSLKAGVRALPADVSGALICLGDMPRISASLLDRMIETFDPGRGALIVAPVRGGERGNPVLWARRFFPDLLALDGDTGARKLTAAYSEGVAEIEAPNDGIFFDIDTPEALDGARRKTG